MNIQLHESGARFALHFEETLAHAQAEVWTALTQPAQISQWMPVQITDLDLRPGGLGTVVNPDGTQSRSQVTAYDPPHTFAFRTLADGETPGERDNIVSFALTAAGPRTLLQGIQIIDQRTIAPFVACGWEACLVALNALLASEPITLAPPTVATFEHYLHELDFDHPVIEPIPGGNRVRIERQTMLQPVAKVWNIMTSGIALNEGDFAPPLFTGSWQSGRISVLEPGVQLEYLTADGGRIRWQFHDHFNSARLTLAVALPRTIDATEAAQTWHSHLESIIARTIATT